MNNQINITEFDIYKYRESTSSSLLRHSYRVLLKSKIGENIEEAIALQKALFELQHKASFDGVVLPLTIMQHRLYNNIEDDIHIVSSLENYAKGILLRNGIIIHTICKPNKLKEKQKIEPIALRCYTDPVLLVKEKTTISCSTIISDSYADVLDIPQEYRKIFRDIINRRNVVHMYRLQGFIMEDIFLEAIFWLRSAVFNEYTNLIEATD